MSNYKSNQNVVYDCNYHVVFCPKYRKPVIDNKVAERFKEIVYELSKELDFEVKSIETMPDHVHLLINCDPQFGIHKIVKRVKGRSSRFLRLEFPHLKSKLPTLWTNSYFVATVGGAPISKVKEYIENQQKRSG